MGWIYILVPKLLMKTIAQFIDTVHCAQEFKAISFTNHPCTLLHSVHDENMFLLVMVQIPHGK